MKNSRICKVLFLILLVCVTLCVFTACFEPEHTHNYTEQRIEKDYLSSPATCAQKAKYYYSCSCGVHGDTTFEYGDKLEHSFTNYVSDSNATYTADGTKTAVCDNGCGETDTVTDVGSMLIPSNTANYTVEYYLQNLEDDNYTKELSEIKVGEKNAVATAEIKTFEHFVYNKRESTTSGIINADGSLVLKVYYTREVYIVIFSLGGATVIEGEAVQSIKYGGSAIPPVIEKEGYTFDRFEEGYDYITQDKSFVSYWTGNIYNITLNLNGVGELSSTTKTVVYDCEYILPVPEKENFEFLGWYYGDIQMTDSDGFSLSDFTMASDVELEARWLSLNPFAQETFVREGNYLYFGRYPQTLKESNVTILNVQDRNGYYLGSDNEYYAKIKTNVTANLKFKNGEPIVFKNEYYFKVEPIKWRILDESNSGAFILCEDVIDSRIFDDSLNNYKESLIRAWLNEEFYKTAFNELQRNLIKVTEVDNSESTTFTPNATNHYVCENTFDKIFLPSYKDLRTPHYGFNMDYSNRDLARLKQSTDYIRAKGEFFSTFSIYDGCSCYLTRSPITGGPDFVSQVYIEGYLNVAYYGGNCGIAPALNIQY